MQKEFPFFEWLKILQVYIHTVSSPDIRH